MKETKLPCDTCIVDIVCDEACDKLLDRDKIITSKDSILERLSFSTSKDHTKDIFTLSYDTSEMLYEIFISRGKK